jgi:peptidoglycan hydrolase CwlO-like protein
MVDFVAARAQLNYRQVEKENPNWSHLMINDYLGITQNTSQILNAIIENQKLIEQLQQEVADIELEIDQLQNQINQVTTRVKTNEVLLWLSM